MLGAPTRCSRTVDAKYRRCYVRPPITVGIVYVCQVGTLALAIATGAERELALTKPEVVPLIC